MNVEKLNKANELDKKIFELNEAIEDIDSFIKSSRQIAITHYYGNEIYLKQEEVNLLLPLLKLKKIEELKKLEKEFEEL